MVTSYRGALVHDCFSGSFMMCVCSHGGLTYPAPLTLPTHLFPPTPPTPSTLPHNTTPPTSPTIPIYPIFILTVTPTPPTPSAALTASMDNYTSHSFCSSSSFYSCNCYHDPFLQMEILDAMKSHLASGTVACIRSHCSRCLHFTKCVAT